MVEAMASSLREIDHAIDVTPAEGVGRDPTRLTGWLIRRWWVAVVVWAAATVWLFRALSH
jgi:hypothetical protein